MIDFKKMDERDFVFISRDFTLEEEKAFSDFLKKRKQKMLNSKTKHKELELVCVEN